MTEGDGLPSLEKRKSKSSIEGKNAGLSVSQGNLQSPAKYKSQFTEGKKGTILQTSQSKLSVMAEA